MIESAITIKNKSGLHARAATRLVETVANYSSTIEISNGKKTVDGKNIISLMLLAATPGSTLSLYIDGSDEKEALQAIQELAENNFGE